MDRPVALKYIHARHAEQPTIAARFEYEARITERLQHPVYEVGTLGDGRPFPVMKLIEGQTLHERLRQLGPEAATSPTPNGVPTSRRTPTFAGLRTHPLFVAFTKTLKP